MGGNSEAIVYTVSHAIFPRNFNIIFLVHWLAAKSSENEKNQHRSLLLPMQTQNIYEES